MSARRPVHIRNIVDFICFHFQARQSKVFGREQMDSTAVHRDQSRFRHRKVGKYFCAVENYKVYYFFIFSYFNIIVFAKEVKYFFCRHRR